MNIYKVVTKTDCLEFRFVLVAENRVEANMLTTETMHEHEYVGGKEFEIISMEEIPLEKGIISCNVYDFN